MPINETPDQNKLKELFILDPSTGLLIWRVNRGRAKKGFPAGKLSSRGYVYVRVDGKEYLLHRLVFKYVNGVDAPAELDHKNQNRLDNRPCNLRQATRAENSRNRAASRNNKLGVKGVYQDKHTGKFGAYMKVNGRSMRFGFHDRLEDAVAARKAAEDKYFGAFAPSNADRAPLLETRAVFEKRGKERREKTGVSYSKSISRWRATAYGGGLAIHLGTFKTEAEARNALARWRQNREAA